MRRALSCFAARLRQQGVPVSPAELLDAAAALADVDLADREALAQTLQAVLVKRREEIDPFERVFSRFFAPPAAARPSRPKRSRRPAGSGAPEGNERAGHGAAGCGVRLQGILPRPGERPGAGAPRRQDASRAVRAAHTARRAAGQPVVVRAPHRRPTRGAMATKATPPARAATRPVAAWRVEIARKPFRELWSPEEARALAGELVRLLARLRQRRSRRRRHARRGGLWVQRLLRANVGHDGVPLRLVRRAPARREPRLLLLVDVSHSVRRAAAAFMTIVAGLARSFRHARVVFFVDQPVDMSASLSRLARLEGSAEQLAALARAVPELNDLAPSDYGRVFDRLARETAPRLRSDTWVLVLGDARTNRFAPLPWALEALRARARRVIWLLPEPLAQWSDGDCAIAAYAPHCDLLCEAADLAGLEHGLRQALRL